MKANKLTKETIGQLGQCDRNFPKFEVGDTIAVSRRIKEGNKEFKKGSKDLKKGSKDLKEADKERLQVFEGDVIAIKNNGAASTFTIRKIGANAIGVELILPYYSPLVDSIAFVRSGKRRRAKLYYMRDRIGKAARVKEKVMTREQRDQKLAGSRAQSKDSE